MKAPMMEVPLGLTHLLERSARYFANKEVVSVSRDGSLVRLDWGRVRDHVGRLANALQRLGLRPGDRVASLAWNTHSHLELYFAVPAMGAVLHTINGRLSPEQVTRIAEHAGDRFVFADPELAPPIDGVAGVEAWIAVDGAPPGAKWQAYEALLQASEPRASFPIIDEDEAAALCYTSGTTGEPKGVLYSHRGLALHTLAISLPDSF